MPARAFPSLLKANPTSTAASLKVHCAGSIELVGLRIVRHKQIGKPAMSIVEHGNAKGF